MESAASARLILEAGNCRDERGVFADTENAETVAAARDLCANCPQLELCRQNLGPVAVELTYGRPVTDRVIAGSLYRLSTPDLRRSLGDPLREAAQQPQQLLDDLRYSVQGDAIAQALPAQTRAYATEAADHYLARSGRTDDSLPQTVHKGWQYLFRALAASAGPGLQAYLDHPERFQAMAELYFEDIQLLRRLGINRRPESVALYHPPSQVQEWLIYYTEHTDLAPYNICELIMDNVVHPEAAFATYFAHRRLLRDHFTNNPYVTDWILRNRCIRKTNLDKSYAAVLLAAQRLQSLIESPRTSKYPLWLLEQAACRTPGQQEAWLATNWRNYRRLEIRLEIAPRGRRASD